MLAPRLSRLQWVVLLTPLILVVGFLLSAAGWQIHRWGLSWLWAVFTLLFVAWRWLLVKWTAPSPILSAGGEDFSLSAGLGTASPQVSEKLPQVEALLQTVLTEAREDQPLWEDWPVFGRRCLTLVEGVAQIYAPQEKYPLLNLYIPSAYQLLRGTLEDVDQWMASLAPTLNQVTVAQGYRAYETYQNLEPTLRRLGKVWYWSQWLLNPVQAAARFASDGSAQRAQAELLLNLSQLLRETILRNLCRQALALYSAETPAGDFLTPITEKRLQVKSQTLRELLAQGTDSQTIAQAPLVLGVVGRTGAGKSSLINSLFQKALALTDVLPNTADFTEYQWHAPGGEILKLWDSPGYEQSQRRELRQEVLDRSQGADLILLLTPALDPALEMDGDFLRDLRRVNREIPVILVVTQVDRLRPLREWNPPYDWLTGERPKERAIREALAYRSERLGADCGQILPLVSADEAQNRAAWGLDRLAVTLVEAIGPGQETRLAQFLADLDARALAAAKLIERYTLQMATTQGLTAFLKSPVLKFIATLTTGSPTLAYLLAEQIPVEQLPVAIGKLQMAQELFGLLNAAERPLTFDLLSLWPVVMDNALPPDRNAWAFGHALIEYWTQDLDGAQLRERFEFYGALRKSP
ncbi:MAG: GTPase family protein [Cyanobacteriota bacterium]